MTKAIEARTNGDHVTAAVERAKRQVAEGAAWVREHPDEALVVSLPALLAWRLSLKYRMGFADHLLITEAGYGLGRALLGTYQEWKSRPARAALKEVA